MQDKFGIDKTQIDDIYINNMDSFESLYSLSSTVSLSVITDTSISTTETLAIEEYKTILKKNTYKWCTMGITRLESRRYYLGALITTIGILDL